MDKQTDGRTDRWTDQPMDGPTEGGKDLKPKALMSLQIPLLCATLYFIHNDMVMECATQQLTWVMCLMHMQIVATAVPYFLR